LVALKHQTVKFMFPEGLKQISFKDEDVQAWDTLKNTKDLFKELRCQQTL